MLGLQTFIQQHTEFMWHLGLSPTQEVLCVRQALLPLSYIPAQPRTIFTTSSIDPFENIDSKTYAALSNVDQLLYTLFLIAFNNITTNLIRKCSEACKLKMKENDFPKFWFFFIWKLKLLLAKEKEDNWFSWSDKITLFILKEASATHSLLLILWSKTGNKGDQRSMHTAQTAARLPGAGVLAADPHFTTQHTLSREFKSSDLVKIHVFFTFSCNWLLWLSWVQGKEEVLPTNSQEGSHVHHYTSLRCLTLIIAICPQFFPSFFWHYWYKYQHSKYQWYFHRAVKMNLTTPTIWKSLLRHLRICGPYLENL